MTTALDNGLWKAADVLGDKGFVKNALSNSNGVCALGALNVAHDRSAGAGGNGGASAFMETEHSDEVSALVGTIKTLWPDRVAGSGASLIMSFNDHPATTKEDLAKAFRVAAAKLATGV